VTRLLARVEARLSNFDAPLGAAALVPREILMLTCASPMTSALALRRTAFTALLAFISTASSLAGCNTTTVTCGPGTQLSGSQCVVATEAGGAADGGGEGKPGGGTWRVRVESPMDLLVTDLALYIQ